MSCAASSKQTAPLNSARYVRKAVLTGMVLLGIMSVSACGKKPSFVDPPEDMPEDVVFPRIYPAPEMNK